MLSRSSANCQQAVPVLAAERPKTRAMAQSLVEGKRTHAATRPPPILAAKRRPVLPIGK